MNHRPKHKAKNHKTFRRKLMRLSQPLERQSFLKEGLKSNQHKKNLLSQSSCKFITSVHQKSPLKMNFQTTVWKIYT